MHQKIAVILWQFNYDKNDFIVLIQMIKLFQNIWSSTTMKILPKWDQNIAK